MLTAREQLYINRCGEQVFAPPFEATLSDFFGFAVQGDHELLKKNICDRFFNGPLNQPDRFTAFQYVIFVFSTIDQAVSGSPEYKDFGYFSYNEAAVWMLVADQQHEQIRWFQPYMFVDDPYAMFAGREIYGFPKTTGTFGIPPGPEAPERLWVKTRVVKAKGGAGETAKLFEVGRPTQLSCTHLHCNDKDDFFANVFETLKVTGPDYFRRFGLSEGFAQSAYDDLIHMRIPLMFLKQFRDGVHPDRAGIHVVQEAESSITEFLGSRLYHDPYELAINDVFSHRVREDLGLGDGQLKVDLSFWMRFRFSLGPCKLITAKETR